MKWINRVPKVKEYRLTCQRDGEVWYTTQRPATRADRIQLAGQKMKHAGLVATPGAGWLLAPGSRRKVAALQAKASPRQCPRCGSIAVTEEPIY